MRLNLLLVAFALGLLNIGSAAAVDQRYIGLQVSGLEFDDPSNTETLEPAGVIGRMGGSLNDLVIFEGRVGAGISDDSSGPESNPTTLDMKYMVGGYALLRGNVSGTLFPYVIAGGTLVDLDASNNPAVQGTETSLSYGLGFDAAVTTKMRVGVEYMRYIDGSDFNLDAIAIGLAARF